MRSKRLPAIAACCLFLIAALASSAVMPRLAVAAEPKSNQPIVYFFWSASCPYSKAARAFLRSVQARDPALVLRDFEIDQSLANSRLLERLYDRIGLPGARVVPTVVIDHQIIVGYIDDDTTGRDILDAVDACRKTACKDAVRNLIEAQDRLDADITGIPLRKIVCDSRPGRAVP